MNTNACTFHWISSTEQVSLVCFSIFVILQTAETGLSVYSSVFGLSSLTTDGPSTSKRLQERFSWGTSDECSKKVCLYLKFGRLVFFSLWANFWSSSRKFLTFTFYFKNDLRVTRQNCRQFRNLEYTMGKNAENTTKELQTFETFLANICQIFWL